MQQVSKEHAQHKACIVRACERAACNMLRISMQEKRTKSPLCRPNLEQLTGLTEPSTHLRRGVQVHEMREAERVSCDTCIVHRCRGQRMRILLCRTDSRATQIIAIRRQARHGKEARLVRKMNTYDGA